MSTGVNNVNARMQVQLANDAVESTQPEVVARVPEHLALETDDDGVVTAWLPPGSQATVQCVPSDHDAAPVWRSDGGCAQRDITVSDAAEQRVTFELPKPAWLTVAVRELGTNAPVAGVTVRFTMIETEYGELGADASAGSAGTHELLTDESGRTPPFEGRAGALLRADVATLPPQLLAMQFLDHAMEQPRVVRLMSAHTLEWVLPRKPRVEVAAHDAASGERIVGVRFRVMARPHSPRAPRPRVSFGGAHLAPGACMAEARPCFCCCPAIAPHS